jgi:hypothetical protein
MMLLYKYLILSFLCRLDMDEGLIDLLQVLHIVLH